MTAGLSVAVVAGGPSSEAEVSRRSAAAVAAALGRRAHRVAVLELDATLARRLEGAFDVVFPAVHGPLGEDGCLQGLLEVLALPYVGSGVLASALAASKPHAKVMFRAAGLPVAEEELVRAGDVTVARARAVRDRLGAAVVVKPAGGGSAIGVTPVGAEEDDAALVAAFERALSVDGCALVERHLQGKEVTCAVLEEGGVPRALSPTLILSRAAGWYDFESKYAPGGSTHRCPAPLPSELLERIRTLALRAHVALGARDLSRADFIVDEAAGAATLLEVNTLPGMTETSLFPEAAAEAGVPFEELCDRLVRGAVARPRRPAPEAVPFPDSGR